MIDFLWPQPATRPTLAADEVHVWAAALDQPRERRLELARTLSADEAKRAERFVFDRDRHHFITGRGFLRTILGHYLQVNSGDFRFKYGPQGKPELETNEENGLRFNLSHSGGVVLYAFAYGREIGVDIEATRPLTDMDQIAKRFFSKTEYADLRSLPANQQNRAFFNCWTRKEAYIKAIGDGLRYPLDKFVVSLAPGKPAGLLHIDADPQALAYWSLTELNPAPGYVAALVVGGHNWQLACRQWPELVRQEDSVKES